QPKLFLAIRPSRTSLREAALLVRALLPDAKQREQASTRGHRALWRRWARLQESTSARQAGMKALLNMHRKKVRRKRLMKSPWAPLIESRKRRTLKSIELRLTLPKFKEAREKSWLRLNAQWRFTRRQKIIQDFLMPPAMRLARK